jgi:hypothetical protein
MTRVSGSEAMSVTPCYIPFLTRAKVETFHELRRKTPRGGLCFWGDTLRRLTRNYGKIVSFTGILEVFYTCERT